MMRKWTRDANSKREGKASWGGQVSWAQAGTFSNVFSSASLGGFFQQILSFLMTVSVLPWQHISVCLFFPYLTHPFSLPGRILSYSSQSLQQYVTVSWSRGLSSWPIVTRSSLDGGRGSVLTVVNFQSSIWGRTPSEYMLAEWKKTRRWPASLRLLNVWFHW